MQFINYKPPLRPKPQTNEAVERWLKENKPTPAVNTGLYCRSNMYSKRVLKKLRAN